MRRGFLARSSVAVLAMLTSLVASTGAAQAEPPGRPVECGASLPVTRPPAQAVVPGVARAVLLDAGDFAGGSWQRRLLAPAQFFGSDELTQAGIGDSVAQRSLSLLIRQDSAPEWQGQQRVWRLRTPEAAVVAFEVLRNQALCQIALGAGGRVTDERKAGTGSSLLVQIPRRGTGSQNRTYSESSWVVLTREADLLSATRLLVTATPAELRQVDLALVGERLVAATSERLTGRPPHHRIHLPVDAARPAPPPSVLLPSAELGARWRLLPETFVGFAGYLDTAGRSGRCLDPANDIAIFGSRTASYRAPGDTVHSVVSYLNVSQLFPGYGPRYMAQVRRNITLGCSSVQLAVPAARLRGIGDDALLLTAAKGVSGQPPLIIVRMGDRVAIFGLFGSAQKSSPEWKVTVARRIASRL